VRAAARETSGVIIQKDAPKSRLIYSNEIIPTARPPRIFEIDVKRGDVKFAIVDDKRPV
jgi:hypothetical protein